MKKYKGLTRHLLAGTAAVAMLGGVVTVAPTASVVAQDYTTGTMEGVVQDTSGSIVPGATIAVASNKGTRRSVATDEKGKFRVPRLPIGRYTVTINADGYDELVSENVGIRLGSAGGFTFTMASSAGEIEQIVVVGTAQGSWDFNSTTTGLSLDVTEMAEKFPVNRNLTDLALFAPGTQQGDSAFGNLASFSGGSVAENAYYVNGMNTTNFRNFTGSSVVPFEFYEQVEVKTGGYQAEFGRSIGGFTNSVTKSGSDEFKASASMYWAPSWADEAPLDSEISGNRRSLNQSNDFDLVLEASGPIVKDKLYFFGLYNHRRNNSDTFGTTRANENRDEDPFWGFKIDFLPFEGHRLEATVWSDSRTINSTSFGFDGDETVGSEVGTSFSEAGGRNEIFKYTGVFADWFTITGLYGKNRYERTNQSTQDACPLVFERMTNPNSSATIGCWTSSFVSQGADAREAYRVDADFYFSGLGEHHVRVGYDTENLTADELSTLSGGEYWRYHFCTSPTGCFGGQIAENDEYVRHLIINNGGSFKNKQTAFYIQDAWRLSDDFSLTLGIRNETFDNKNANGESFIKVKNQWAGRFGLNWDPFGKGKDRVTAFFGRYYMPIAANTNIRMAGAETFIQEFCLHDGFDQRDPTTAAPSNPQCGPSDALQYTVTGDGEIPPVDTIKDQNVDPLYSDEYILGYEHVFDNGWTVGIRGMYRTLGSQIDDVGINHATVAWALENGYELDDVFWILDPAQHGIDYVLTNPGTDMRVATDLLTDDGSLVWMDLTADMLEYEQVKRKYKAIEVTFSREDDGVWSLDGSYTFSTVRGNTEGVVKSDNGQDDAGLTQDFDLVALMIGAEGPLPTENKHKLKLWGSYKIADWLRVGGRATITAPRKFGCLGVLPDGTFGNAANAFDNAGEFTGDLGALRQIYEDRYGADYWFCDGESTPRGSQLKSQWIKRLDLNFTIIPAFAESIPGEFRMGVDIFNVFNARGISDRNEFGETYAGVGVGVADPDYGVWTNRQAPRNIRFNAKWSF